MALTPSPGLRLRAATKARPDTVEGVYEPQPGASNPSIRARAKPGDMLPCEKAGSTNLRSACLDDVDENQVLARPDPCVTSLVAAALSENQSDEGHLSRLGS